MRWKRVGQQAYDSNGYQIRGPIARELVKGTWTLQYPGEVQADDSYATLWEAKEEAECHVESECQCVHLLDCPKVGQ